MKKFFALFEDLWVAVAFAEAGEYDTLHELHMQAWFRDAVRMHAV